MHKEIKSQNASVIDESHGWWAAEQRFATRSWFSSAISSPLPSMAPNGADWCPLPKLGGDCTTSIFIHSFMAFIEQLLPASGKAMEWDRCWAVGAGISEASAWRSWGTERACLTCSPWRLLKSKCLLLHLLWLLSASLKHYLKGYFVPPSKCSSAKVKPSLACFRSMWREDDSSVLLGHFSLLTLTPKRYFSENAQLGLCFSASSDSTAWCFLVS